MNQLAIDRIHAAFPSDGVVSEEASAIDHNAERGKGATKNGKPIRASQQATLAQSAGFISTSWTASRTDTLRRLAQEADKERFRASAIGCCGADEVLVASGVHDWVVNASAADWDYVAGALMMREAGCIVSKLDGTLWKVGDKEIAAANPVLHPELIHALNAPIVHS